jgi:hypothetical protein
MPLQFWFLLCNQRISDQMECEVELEGMDEIHQRECFFVFVFPDLYVQ